VGASATEKGGREGPQRRRWAALSVGGGEKQSREVEVEEKGGFAISKKFRDPSVNKQ
jgi:hypothetical protein